MLLPGLMRPMQMRKPQQRQRAIVNAQRMASFRQQRMTAPRAPTPKARGRRGAYLRPPQAERP